MTPGPKSILEQAYIEHPEDQGFDRYGWKAGTAPIKFLTALRVCSTLGDACAVAHISDQTEIDWRRKGEAAIAGREVTPELLDEIPMPDRVYAAWALAVPEAQADAKLGLLGTVAKAGRSDWRPAMAMLERKWPGEFSTRREVTGADGGPVDVNVRADAVRVALEQMQSEGVEKDPM